MNVDWLVIGIGNPDRGDDAAGVLVSRALERTRAKELVDCATLLDAWEGESDVVVVDAMRSGRAPGEVVRFDATVSDLPVRTVSSTHSFGLAEAIALGRVLHRLPHQLVVFGIEAAGFGAGSALSAEVRGAISEVVGAIENEEEAQCV